jgi:hypothetical protein
MTSALTISATCHQHSLDVVDTMVDYLSDCCFDESHMNSMTLTMAMEYIYQPNPRFWRDFNLSFVTAAASRLIQDSGVVPGEITRRIRRLKRAIKQVLRIYRFDEENAEMLSALPMHERPTDRAAAFVWICATYRRQRKYVELAFAQKDGRRCGEGALAVLECVENAKMGLPYERLGTMVARSYRDGILRHREKSRPDEPVDD